MDQHKPLSYQCLKSVIQYMDANFRFLRSRQIASLRKIQKVVPLRLRVLELKNFKITLDNIYYEYQYCRNFIEREGDSVIVFHSLYDIDNDGNEEIFEDLMPGDIVIKERDWRGVQYRNRNFISDSYVKCIRTGLKNQFLHRQSHYGMKIRDMMRKKLYEVLSGKRIHQVEHLKIGVYNGVLRFPEGLKLQIRKLSTVDNSTAVIEAILPILDVSSFPIKSLSVRVSTPQDPVFQSKILRTSEFLNIRNWGSFDNRWANVLINLPNMKIHLTDHISLNDIVLIVRNWIEHPRVIGTRFSVQAESVKEYLDEIGKEFKAVKRVLPETKCIMSFPCFTLPISSTSELNIYGANSPDHEEKLSIRWGPPYMVVIEIMPIGTVEPLKSIKDLLSKHSVNFLLRKH